MNIKSKVKFLLGFIVFYSCVSFGIEAGSMSDSTRELDKLIRERTLENINKEKWKPRSHIDCVSVSQIILLVFYIISISNSINGLE